MKAVGVSGSTGETITINNYDDGRLLTATAAADQIDAESNAKYNDSDGLVVLNSGSFKTQLNTGAGGIGDLLIGHQTGSMSPSVANDKGWRLHAASTGFYNDVQNGSNQRMYWRYYDGSGGIFTKAQLDITTGKLILANDVVAFGTPSDKSLKENIQTISNALEKVKKLRGVSFNWKEKPGDILDIKEDLGFIAQEVKDVLPELVRTNEDGKMSLRQASIIPLLVEAIKELQDQIDELKSKL
jgi:hypothetical protein